MIPYFLVLIFIFALWVYFDNKHQDYKFIGAIACGVVMAVFSGIRSNVGRDYPNYKKIFMLQDVAGEKGFNALVHFFNSIGLNYEALFFLFAIITVWLAVRYINKYSQNIFLSFLIFFAVGQFYFNTFNSMRQCIVAYVFYNILVFIENRNIVRYIIVVLLCAFFFHTTALILLPLYFVIHRKFHKLTYLIVLGGLVFSSSFIMLLIKNSPYAIYLKMEEFTSGVSVITYFLLLISLGLFFFYNKFDTTRQKIFFNINVLAIASNALSIVFANTPLIMVTNRLSYYFTPVLIVMIPNFIYDSFEIKTNRQIFICGCVGVFTLLFLVTLVLNGKSNSIVPYQTILF